MRTGRNKLIFEIQDNFIPCSGIFSDPFEKEAHEIATYIAHYLDPQAHESHQFGRYVAEACRAIIRNSSLKHAPETLEKLEQMAKDQRKSKGLLIDELLKLL